MCVKDFFVHTAAAGELSPVLTTALFALYLFSLWLRFEEVSSTKPLQQNKDRKHRTYVFTLTVTETLEDWEDSVNIGMSRRVKTLCNK